jgi:hypothetical protein
MVRNHPYYSLKKVKLLVQKNILINPNARYTASRDFGWDNKDIKKALLRLQPKHFYKPGTRYDDPSVHVDYYKARNLIDEDVYIHFRVEKDDNQEDRLIICSFKRI